MLTFRYMAPIAFREGSLYYYCRPLLYSALLWNNEEHEQTRLLAWIEITRALSRSKVPPISELSLVGDMFNDRTDDDECMPCILAETIKAETNDDDFVN